MMNIVLTIGRAAPAGSKSIYLDFKNREVSRGRERVRLWPRAFIMVAAILVSPKRLDHNELVQIVYGDRLDGGPNWARTCTRNALQHARERLRRIGIDCRVLMHGSSGYEALDLWNQTPAGQAEFRSAARQRRLARLRSRAPHSRPQTPPQVKRDPPK